MVSYSNPQGGNVQQPAQKIPLSSIALSSSAPSGNDTIVGVNKNNQDVRFNLTQMQTLNPATNDSVKNVKTFGAVGDGVNDDSTAILAAVNAAASLTPLGATRGVVYFPAGIYKITQSAVLTETNTDHSNGIHYFGAGRDSSVLRLATTSSDLWFYDPVATPRMQFNSFSDLQFQGMDPASFSTFADIPVHAKGFRLWSTQATGSHEQNFKFTRCIFSYLNIAFDTEGDQTTSENSFLQCDFLQISNAVLVINNVQSFNHEFQACNMTNIYGNVFHLVSGGGSLKMFGGSVVMFSTGVDNYFLLADATIGLGSFPFLFSGQRFEFHGNNSKLFSIADTVQVTAAFDNCLFEDQGTAAKLNFGSLASASRVEMKGCTFYEQGVGSNLRFTINDNVSKIEYAQNGSIMFSRCGLPDDWSDRCTVAHFKGRISAQDCYGLRAATLGGGPGGDYGKHWAQDFDLNWEEPTPGLYTGWVNGTGANTNLRDGGSPADHNRRLKTAYIMMPDEFWPTDGFDLQLRMPRNAIIKNIHLRKPPSGGAQTTSCAMLVGRQDKSGTPHLTSNTAAYNAAQTGDVSNYFYQLGNTNNERWLRLYASVTGLTENNQGGFCLIEYY